ncbi:centromere protein W [Notothenia coriiceps]|uniref:Centromere protein W n=1 Tax=Notothenia coriiceps TaxID=8208 RepID=A0A6I9NHG8_9TELE|nr:PREDICTED: centromere protein W [Notothenia coriiceps]
MQKKTPKLKSIIKAKAKTNIIVGTASEAMIELLTLMFLSNLAEEAKAKAFEEKSATIRDHHLKAVSKKMLKKAKG